MAFALTSFVADGVRFSGPGPYRATEQYVFTVTGAATDVDLDIGDATGTFWTAAQADATYGEMAAQVLAQIQSWEANYQAVKSIYTPQIDAGAFLKVASLSATGTYTLDVDATTLLPNYGFYTAGATTAYTVFVEYLLSSNRLPTVASYNVA